MHVLDERRIAGTATRVLDNGPFNCFIEDNFLVDLPLQGRKYTWYKGDGKSMSRLDMFLPSEDWCLKWTSCLQVAHLCGISDHCLVVLIMDEENWVPRPCRMLKCWLEIP